MMASLLRGTPAMQRGVTGYGCTVRTGIATRGRLSCEGSTGLSRRGMYALQSGVSLSTITKIGPESISGFLSPFGDMPLWNILISCIVLPYISPYSRMINRMLWGHILSVAPETSSMEGGARFHLDTSHHRPDPFVT